MNMIIPFIALFLPPIASRETRNQECISNIAHVLSRVSNVIDRRQRQKRKRNKECDQTRFVCYIRYNS